MHRRGLQPSRSCDRRRSHSPWLPATSAGGRCATCAGTKGMPMRSRHRSTLAVVEAEGRSRHRSQAKHRRHPPHPLPQPHLPGRQGMGRWDHPPAVHSWMNPSRQPFLARLGASAVARLAHNRPASGIGRWFHSSAEPLHGPAESGSVPTGSRMASRTAPKPAGSISRALRKRLQRQPLMTSRDPERDKVVSLLRTFVSS